MPDRLRLLGLDIGGSRSRARLWAGGQVVTESQAPSASLPAAGADAAGAAIGELIAGLRLDPADRIDAICAGSAGLSVPGAREFLLAQLAPLTRPGAVTIVSDATLVLPAAGLAAGVAVICGTASVGVGTDGCCSIQAGGWGYLLGDEGGGYWIVREALRVLLGRRDCASPPGELGGALLSATGAADVSALQGQFYQQPHHPRDWAQLAPVVLGSADPAATDIATRAAEAVADLAAAAARELASRTCDPGAVTAAAPDPAARQYAAIADGAAVGAGTDLTADRIPVVLAGGLTANAAFAAAACRAVRQRLPGAAVRILADEPVAGAIRLAAQAVRSVR